MSKIYYIFLFVILFISSCGIKTNNINSEQSNIDLVDSTFNSKIIYSLNGNWEFYWDTLLTPSQIKTTELTPLLVSTPATWGDYSIDNKKLSQSGKATYHLKVKILPEKFYSLKFKRIFLSYKVWINDSIVLEVGKVSANKKDFIPNDLTKEYVFYSQNSNLDITIQVANYGFRKAGITNTVKLGTPESIENHAYSNLLYEVFIIGALVFMMLFYFILFFYNKKVISNLYYSLFLLFEVITLGFDGELFVLRIFPDIHWIIVSKLWNVASFMRPLFLLLFIEGLTRVRFSQIFKKISIYFAIAMAVFVAIMPVEIYTHTLLFFIFFVVVTLLYELYVTAISVKDSKNILFAFLGLSVILLTTINDSLYDYGIFTSFYSVGLGVFVFAVLQAFLLSIKNAELFKQAENLTSSVEIQNRLKEELLSTPSYDLGKSLYAFIKTVGVEKILIFSIEKENIFVSNIIEKDKIPETVEISVELEKKYDFFCSPLVREAFQSQESVFLSTKRKNNEKYLIRNKIKSIVVIPIVKNEKTIATVYMENKERPLNNAQQSVLKTASSQFYSIINTAVAYFKLQAMKQYLEAEVKERTVEVEKQKEEIDVKNQQLDEKIQLLEEQYTIQQEINDELEAQNIKLEQQNSQLSAQNQKIGVQKEQLESHNRQISENIEYASTILSALKNADLEIPFRDSFVFEKPRDIVSGDFFWSKKIENNFIFALADSTGHGVPGALMSLLGIRLINKIVVNSYAESNDVSPAEILNKLRSNVKKQLTDENKTVKDGYDMSFCIYNEKTKELNFAGAYNSLFIIRNKEIIQIKGDRMPIGAYIENFEFPFKNKKIILQKNDCIYLTTDGFIDQFGGENNNKFYLSNFKKMILEISNDSFDKQLVKISKIFDEWKGNNSQLDDVSVVGFLV